MDLSRFGLANLFRGRFFMVAAILLLALSTVIVAACGDDDDDDGDDGGDTPAASTVPPNGGDGSIDYGSLSGEVIIDGSSTVEPISSAMAEEFNKVASGVQVNVATSGTGGGFEKFCNNEIDISDASRPITDNDDPDDLGEVQVCAQNGIEDIVEIQVAIDALTVMVHPDNDFVECLTVDQLHEIFRTGGATNWNEIDPTFPDEPISWYYPDVDSGTFDYFVEAIIEGVDEAATHRGDGVNSVDDNVLALGIEGDENAIGYFGFAYYLEAGDALKAVQVDNGDGCVEPSFDTALDGTYEPLSRPLFIYTREEFLAGHPDNPVLGFVKFYLDNTEEIVPQVGYITLPEDIFATQVAKIDPFLP